MKRTIILYLLIILISVDNLAQIEFIDVTNQPVFGYGEAGEWDEGAVWFPSVIKDEDTLRMWYTGYDNTVWNEPKSNIGYAWSLDGINWNRFSGNPVLTPELPWEGQDLSYCTVIKDVDTLKMWYRAGGNPGGPPKIIGYATSFDGITWSKHSDPVLQLGPHLDWDDDRIAPHTVIKEDSEYKMWFWAGRPGFPFEESLPQTGLATSPDGIHWTKYDDPATSEAPFANSDPVLKVGSSSDWDSHRVINPIVLSTESGYEMWYTGLTAPINTKTKLEIGYATSADGINWIKWPENPILPDSLTWGKGIYGGSVLKYDEDYHFWFACFHTPPTQAQPQIGYAKSGYVSIPDTAFLYALIERDVDTNGDSLISYAEAEAISHLSLYWSNISSVTGIEAFVNLDSLNCVKNLLTSLDVSKNTALTYLNCEDNNLTSLDVSNNTALSELYCFENQLTSLNVSNNTVLKDLDCGGNLLTGLDVSENTALIYMNCEDNNFTNLKISNNTGLRYLNCDLNQLTSLDVSTNTALEELHISDMPTLFEVCVWGAFPAGVEVNTKDSPNVCFETDCSGECGDDNSGIEGYGLKGLSIYPNPISDFLTIETSFVGQHSIEITSLNGQLIYHSEMEGTPHQIDLSAFQKGVYFITIRSKDFVKTDKMIKL